ncbi:MAG TPA: 16S rRNA (guanine(527)-N(7))-methyltransferase RsmG [Devosia sp.]|nr:16S rRNA (guanine(527)-N(7))-methyltransferase RsmG [Devosia sp.]
MSQAHDVLWPYADHLSRPLPEVAEDLEAFAALLFKWNKAQNLVSRETVGDLWPRHIADSLQVLPLLKESDVTLLDLGSGGGFPSIPVAIASKGQRNPILVEPIGKKASFLKAVNRELGLGMRVESVRAESLDPENCPPVDVVTSRALAPLTALCSMALPFWRPNTRAIFHKGREHVEELAESGASYYFDVVVHPSRTDDSGVLIELSKLRKR